MDKNVTVQEVIEWGREFLDKSEKALTPDELKEQKKYADLIQQPKDKILLSKMLDESSQIRNNRRLAERMKLLIDRYGVPGFFNSRDALLLKMFSSIGYKFDSIAIPIFKNRLRSDTAKVIINEKPSFLKKHLDGRYSQQIGQNVNLLGEVVLGDGEANHRYQHYLEALKDPRINYISIKISGIYAQINALNYAQNKKDLCERLSTIYRQAMQYPYTDSKGVVAHKFVNLDMEEYKDTELTLDVFMEVLSMPEFKNYKAGIVIQAYLPDAANFQTQLLKFAHQRVADGGAALKMRLVKGANLQMESIVSSLKGWENPVLDTKIKVDANYLHLLDIALKPENAAVVHVGVASHNFFSIGYAYLLAKQNGVDEYITFEMLEGMANHLPRVMRELGNQIILYTPVVKDENFLNAVSYLVRRLDENTGPDNFLSYSFNLKVDSVQWEFLKKQFVSAFAMKDNMEPHSKRRQNRLITSVVSHTQVPIQESPYQPLNEFINEPDTNFDLRANRVWAETIREAWQKTPGNEPLKIPVQLGEEQLETEHKLQFTDHSNPHEVVVYEASLSTLEHVKEMLVIAGKDESSWRESSLETRKDILFRTAGLLATRRGLLIGCMSAVTGKTFAEGDVEVSEAIDFCRYYPLTMQSFAQLETVKIKPKGIVLVIPPWNFPLAIPVGGVAAALACGNTVILKPASVALPVAWEFAQCFWDAGVPKDALQIVCTHGREPLNYLTAHSSIKHIIMTGGTDTAFHLLKNNPSCPLSAETGGKNAIIVSAAADRDHAIQNIVTSAFSNAGQKCSACSLLILEKEVYNDESFQRKLVDAVTSLHTGSPWDGGNYVGPMITPKNDKLLHAISHLEKGEWWLVAPEFADKKKYMLKPCVKWGVKPGSFSFVNELFAPMLSVVCADNFEHAISLANSSEYGLTAGLQTLDESERALWRDKIEAGNLYINRGITGAIVSRQPFGGMKRSAFGGGIKAGGPNYVSSFVEITNSDYHKKATIPSPDAMFKTWSGMLRDDERRKFEFAVHSYIQNMKTEFSVERDIHNLYGEQNIFRYRPLKNMLYRVYPTDKLLDVLMVLAAANIANTALYVSISATDEKLQLIRTILDLKYILVQHDEVFIDQIEQYERIRTTHNHLSDAVYKKAAQLGKYIATQSPLMEGRLELLHYFKEQSVTYEYHRYGSITETLE